jgi:hypothetical protein
VDKILIDVDEKLDAIGNWNKASVHYRYIKIYDVEVSGQNAQAQGKSFWQEHYKLTSGTIPEVVDTTQKSSTCRTVTLREEMDIR